LLDYWVIYQKVSIYNLDMTCLTLSHGCWGQIKIVEVSLGMATTETAINLKEV